jgi:serine/threonine-protein kinase HipA|tara:strand:+ start:270 stop:1322 length:1053 start_codon:yes stop_codon:yes gene_type:complete
VFDNLLPDRNAARRRVAARMGAQGTDFYSLLEAIGRDCVGAMRFLPEGTDQAQTADIESEPVSETEVEALLADLAQAPLGVDREQEFRISVAGAQEKTALLRIDGKWHRPAGVTPTTYILKPELGQIPSADGMIDMSNSVDNEHYCMTLMKAFGLSVAATEIATVGQRRVLVVERFHRHWRNAKQILCLPQEDCCQALGYPPTHKYQSDGGPNMKDIFGLLLRGADDPQADAAALFKSQILFYDVLSAQPAVDSDQIAQNRFPLAMSAGTNHHYRLNGVTGRHFVQSGKSAGLGTGLMRAAISELMDRARDAPTVAREAMPVDFAEPVHDSIAAALATRLSGLSSALEEL